MKELDLSEGHSSGIPTIQEELERNGSPRAEFFTDEDRRAMRIRNPIHSAFLEENVIENVIENVTELSEEKMKSIMQGISRKKLEKMVKILNMISKNPSVSMEEIKEELNVTDRTVARYLAEMKENKIIERVGPDKGGYWKIISN